MINNTDKMNEICEKIRNKKWAACVGKGQLRIKLRNFDKKSVVIIESNKNNEEFLFTNTKCYGQNERNKIKNP